MSRTVIEAGGKRLSVTNLGKDLYPRSGFTKAGILDYYRAAAPFMLPHLRGRAATFKRYPDGTDQPFFFEKRCPSHRPEWVRTAEVSPSHGGDPLRFCVVEDLETLLWAANLAALELHVPLARAESPSRPDSLIFDLDPGEGAGLAQCARVALILRDLLARLGLASRVKTSGQKGLHVVVPLNDPKATFNDTKTFSKATAEILERHYPGLVTASMAKQERVGKVFINWSQNDDAKTMICVYSLRAREAPFVSFPVTWKALEDPAANEATLQVVQDEALRRLQEQGDLFREVLVREQRLPHL